MSAPNPEWYLRGLEALKSFPLWILAALAVFFNVSVFVPEIRQTVPTETINYFKLGALLFSVLTLSAFVENVFALVKKRRGHKTFHITPASYRNTCIITPQPDGTFITQIRAEVTVKSLSNDSLHLLGFAFIKPRMTGELLNSHIALTSPNGSHTDRLVDGGIPPFWNYACQDFYAQTRHPQEEKWPYQGRASHTRW